MHQGASFETFNSRAVSTYSTHFSYNEVLDIYTLLTGLADNTYNSIGHVNTPNNINIDIWENEDGRYSGNAFVGNRILTNITSDDLTAEDRALLTDNSFDELYKLYLGKKS